MNTAARMQNITRSIAQLEKSMQRLKRSWDACSHIPDISDLSEADYDALEAMAGRFSRTSDILIQKVFRSLDAYELYESGTPLDVINRADKRELFDDVNAIKRIRALRNRIAHEYELEDLAILMREMLALTPVLLDTCTRTIEYAMNIIRS
ncbi:MAG: hypothetical protein ACLGSA_10950 [Acidobacteriota bacterium]